jgi:hypothetical protein
MTIHDREILEAALLGYTLQQKVIDGKITEIKSRLNSSVTAVVLTEKPAKRPRRKHKFSKESRQKMAEAQKRRWAAAKKQATT